MVSERGAFDPGAPLTNGHPETPQQRALRLRAEAFRQRMHHALHQADLAFWSEISKSFPEISSGDVTPEMIQEWDNAMGKVLYHWMRMNAPENNELLDRIVKGS